MLLFMLIDVYWAALLHPKVIQPIKQKHITALDNTSMALNLTLKFPQSSIVLNRCTVTSVKGLDLSWLNETALYLTLSKSCSSVSVWLMLRLRQTSIYIVEAEAETIEVWGCGFSDWAKFPLNHTPTHGHSLTPFFLQQSMGSWVGIPRKQVVLTHSGEVLWWCGYNEGEEEENQEKVCGEGDVWVEVMNRWRACVRPKRHTIPLHSTLLLTRAMIGGWWLVVVADQLMKLWCFLWLAL